MTKFKITAIVPCYNNKEELVMTLYSLGRIKETYFSIEIIIVDGSQEILRKNFEISECISKLHKEGIRVIYISGMDSGPYDAMNKGINKIGSDSKWIWFMNSGDEALTAPNKVSFSSNCSVIIGGWHGKKNINKLIVPSEKMGLSMTRYSNIGSGICHQAMLFKNNKYGNKFYNWRKYKYAAELDYYIDSILQGDYIVDSSFLCRYDNLRGISQSNAINHFNEQYEIFEAKGIKVSKYMKLKCWSKAIIREKMSDARNAWKILFKNTKK